MAKTDSATSRSYWEAEDKHDVQRFIGNMDSVFPYLKKKGRLPTETTCAWTRAQENNDFAMRQIFANFTAEVVLDLSAHALVWLGGSAEHRRRGKEGGWVGT